MTMWSTDAMALSLQSRAHFVDLMVDLIFKKWSGTVNFSRFYVKWSSVHILSTSSSKSAPSLLFFYNFYVKSSSCYGLVHILSTSSSKTQKKLSAFNEFYMKSSSRYSLTRILLTTFRIEPRTRGNRDPPAATKDGHFTRKKHRVVTGCAPESVFSREFTPSRSLTLPNLMMMWLT